MSEVPQNLDWVKERGECSLRAMFIRLNEDLKKDVRARNRYFDNRDVFKVVTNENIINVYLNVTSKPKSVVFTLAETEINVADGNGQGMFKITLTLNDEGHCKPKVDGQERELWQVRRRALEDFFFGDLDE